jgi:rRNA-processing protein FCF1
MGKKRSFLEIQADVKRLLEISKTVSTMSELTKATGMSYAKINYTFSKYPDSYQKLKDQLAANLANGKSKAKSEKAATPLEGLEVSLEPKQELNVATTKPVETATCVGQDEEPEFTCGFVVDASIMKLDGADIFLNRLLTTKGKIILTSMTIKELDKMQSFEDEQAIHTRHFLARAASEPELFICVQIDETIGIPDDCIIAYCRQHRDKVTLLTGDKVMALKARSYPRPIQVQYFAANDSLDEQKEKPDTKGSQSASDSANKWNKQYKICTLIPAEKYNGKLQIFEFENTTQSIRVTSNGKHYSSGPYELHIGDDILIATQKSAFITFAHYRVISLSETNNCETIFSKQLPLDSPLTSIRNSNYLSFLRKFMEVHNL